jgi:predicted transglutaminase-like cysteine proteinase
VSAKSLLLAVAACVAIAATAFAGPRGARPATSIPPSATAAPTTGRTSTPWGWADFCARYRDECGAGPTTPAEIELTARTWALLEQVNARVNGAVKPMADLDHWGVVDQWDLPLDGYGDCEDYALYKRHFLISLGLPRQALLMTVVKDENGEGHAILTVKTDHGDFVLDNMRSRIVAWSATPYTFVKRQSQTDENVWDRIGAPTPAPLTVSR